MFSQHTLYHIISSQQNNSKNDARFLSKKNGYPKPSSLVHFFSWKLALKCGLYNRKGTKDFSVDKV
jgi:hypothetical protein